MWRNWQVNIARAVEEVSDSLLDIEEIVVGIGRRHSPACRAGIVAAKVLAFATGFASSDRTVPRPAGKMMNFVLGDSASVRRHRFLADVRA